MKFGTQILGDGVKFRLWAPHHDAVSVTIEELGKPIPMRAMPRDWFEVAVPEARAGMHYCFELSDGTRVTDPAARSLPHDVGGLSQIVDPLAFPWSDRGWVGHAWHDTIIYELHVGAFTPEGTFQAAIGKLDHLVALGINTIELLPVADFKGRWNWGYDGASLFAPDSSYGQPEDMKAFIDAAHAKGISVILDVVYNHFGPRGNHLDRYTPLTTDAIDTPWGPAVNFDGDNAGMIRDLVLTNARYWLTEYNLDGLRLDAVHEIYDDGPRHILLEFAEHTRAATDGRHLHLILENSQNQAGWLKRHVGGAPWLFDAQWSDDVHHALHAIVTGESFNYYADFADRIDLVARALAEGFAFQGEYLEHAGRSKGEPSTFLPATAFVAFAQNHDHIGNRPHGERMGALIGADALRAWSSILLLSPQIPLLFMGEEWNAGTPFNFFSDLGDDLADDIRESRREELKNFPAEKQQDPQDPMAPETFYASKLDWSEPAQSDHSETLSHYRALIALRHAELTPRLEGMDGKSGQYRVLGPRAFEVTWRLGDGSTLTLLANLGDDNASGIKLPKATPLWQQGATEKNMLGPWTVAFFLS